MFKDNLKIARKRKGISKQEMAEKIDVSYMTYSHYENRGSEPPYSILVKISQVLEISIDTLLSDELSTTANDTNNILSIEKLSAMDSMCFTPAYAINCAEPNFINFLKDNSLVDNETFTTAHNNALRKAKVMYAKSFSEEIIANAFIKKVFNGESLAKHLAIENGLTESQVIFLMQKMFKGFKPTPPSTNTDSQEPDEKQ